MTDMIDFGEFSSLSLKSPSVVTSNQCICYPYEDQKYCNDRSSVDELRCRIFTGKKLSGDRLPSTLDVLALMFFHQYLFNIFSRLFFLISL